MIEKFRLLAILRHITPDEVLAVGEILIKCGWTCLEVPMNSPEALKSIQILQDNFADRAIIGAGTVTHPDQVRDIAKTGAGLIVSPNMDKDVIETTKKLDLISIPGVFTPTEAFSAIKYGADALKLFPGEAISAKYIKAIRAVLPEQTKIFVTGGIHADNMQEFKSAGADGFGFGGALYKPEKTLDGIEKDASLIMQRFKDIAN
ncbi:MAG: 2-dehydro-3-deoxy-6-phosphogalactonate aldolase [Pseudomonadota bacterium]